MLVISLVDSEDVANYNREEECVDLILQGPARKVLSLFFLLLPSRVLVALILIWLLGRPFLSNLFLVLRLVLLITCRLTHLLFT